jgi:Heparan-alpha-glucosaminide N-acetyltransferase, catalytic
MVAVHVLDTRTPVGRLTWHAWLVEGRASALFAVLAGVSLVLTSRRTSAGGLAARAVLVAAWGLVLGELDSGLAVILTYYGVLFLLGLPFRRLRARALFAWAAAWLVIGPVVSQMVRPHLPVRGVESPAFGQLAHPGHLLSELLCTGYYPSLTWLAYLLLGMAIGRCDLRSRSVQTGLVLGGLTLSVLAFLVSRSLTEQAWVLGRLVPDAGRYGDVSTAHAFVNAISGGLHGTTPAGGSWAWLLVVAPHSGTPFDLLETGASAALVIGLCLWVVSSLAAGAQRAVAMTFGAGTMTLSLYSLHALLRTDSVWPPEEPSSYPWHVLVLMAIGALFVAARTRGPLEAGLARVSAAATRSRGRCPSPSAPRPLRSGRRRPRR